MHLHVILILALLCRMMLYECLNLFLITDLVSSIYKKTHDYLDKNEERCKYINVNK